MLINSKKIVRFFSVCVGVAVGVIWGAQVFAAAVSPNQSVVNIQTWQTDNGAKVFFVELHQMPIVDARVIFAAGSAYDDKLQGVAHMVSGMLNEGTANLSANQIAESFDRVGSVYSAMAGRDFSFVQFRSLSDDKYFTPTLDVFSEVLTQAKFPQKEFDRVKAQTLISLKFQEQQPSTIASKTFFSTIYGSQPYGHPVQGDTDSVKQITREDLVNFYKRFYVAQNTKIVLVGDLTLDKAKQVAQKLSSQFSTGDKADRVADNGVETQAVEKNIQFPSSQTTVLIGQIGIKENSEFYFPAFVGNYVLGGGILTSRLMKVIREDHGYAYHAASSFVTMRDKGPFMMQLQTRNAQVKNASDLALKTLSEFIAKGPTAQELKLAKQSIVFSFPLKLASNAAIFNNVSKIAAYQLPLNYLDTYRDNVKKVSKKDVLDTFQKLINTKQLVTVTVGNSNG